MAKSDLYELKQLFAEKEILFCYSGAISYEILDSIGKNIRNKIELEEDNTTASKKIFSIFVEVVQNIKSYSIESIPSFSTDDSSKVGIITIGRKNDYFVIEAGNLVSTEDKNRLSEKLEKIQNLDKEELKALYKTERNKPLDRSSNRAGLGLIDIARRSSDKIDYNFFPIAEQTYFYVLTIKI